MSYSKENRNSSGSSPTLLNQKQVAEILGMSPAWCARKRWEGGGPPYIKVGGKVRYREEDLLKWLEAQPLRASTSFVQKEGTDP